MIQVVVANGFLAVLDRAIQVHGAMGVTNDTPLARMWAHARTLRLVDGPDEVHTMVMARREVRRWTAGERVERCEGRCVYGGSLLSEGHAGCVV